MPALTFRFATATDVPSVVALVELAYRGPDASSGWTNETELLSGPRTRTDEVERLVADPGSRFVLAEAEGRLVGCALVQRAAVGGYFGMFSVDPAHQAGGVGRALLAECEQTARSLWSASRMSMSVISLRTDLIAWYERRGYRDTGVRTPFPFHEHSGALRTDFDLVTLVKEL